MDKFIYYDVYEILNFVLCIYIYIVGRHTTVRIQKANIISGVVIAVDIDSCSDIDKVFIKYYYIKYIYKFDV